MSFREQIKKFNDMVALRITLSMGTIWCVYAFFLLSMMPLLTPDWTNIIMYVSSTVIQLVALPAIMVGQQLLNENSEKRAQQDHETILAQFEEIKELHEHIDDILTHVASDTRQSIELSSGLKELLVDEENDTTEIKKMQDDLKEFSNETNKNFQEIQEILYKIENK